MMTGRCWFKVPETIKFIYHGKPKPWVTGKDLILHTIGDIGVDGALYKARNLLVKHLAILQWMKGLQWLTWLLKLVLKTV